MKNQLLKKIVTLVMTLAILSAGALNVLAIDTNHEENTFTGLYSSVAEKSSDYFGHWAEAILTKWTSSGVVKWYGGEGFNPNTPITRAEFSSLVNTIFNYHEKGNAVFTDVPSDAWYANEVAAGTKAGYIEGYEDGTFRPAAPITRQEAAKFIAVPLKLDVSKDEAVLNKFIDAQYFPEHNKGYISAAVNAGYFVGYPDGTFGAENNITRAEALTLLDHVATHVSASDTAPVFELTGWVLDRDCIGADILKHSKGCSLMGSCYDSGLGIYKYIEGASTQTTAKNYLVFDGESKEKTKDYLQNLPEDWKNNISIRITAKLVYNIPANADETKVPETDHRLIDHNLIGIHVLKIEPNYIEGLSTYKLH